MTNGPGTTRNHWAVLIGINFYVRDNHLQGSVRDVETVKEYLDLITPSIDTVILTATTPPDPSSDCPIEKPEQRPTFANVCSALIRVIEEGKQQDSVYIHFSGHGTRIPSEVENQTTPELALVLFESNGPCYFRSRHLATALRRMVDKGLLVTLVLDCCFSGSTVRHSGNHGIGIRATDYKPDFDTERPQGHQESSSGIIGSLRDAQPVPELLVDPKGYAIFLACAPHETAKEIKDEEERPRGAFTYFLICALTSLRKMGVELTNQSLYHYLRTQFHASWPQQTPMQYGNGDSSFFGKLGVAFDRTLVPIYEAHDNRLCLSAGEAHGVCKGDEYAAYPFQERESNLHQTEEAPVKVIVDTVRCLTSDLLEIDPVSTVRRIKTGWKAKPVTNFSLRKISVRLMPNVSNPNEWIEAAKQQRFLRLCTENTGLESCIFNLIRNEHGEYEILGGYGESIISLPTIPINTNGALDIVMDILQHLAKFKYFEGVENRRPNLAFERSLSLLPFCTNQTSDICSVKHGAVWGLTMENLDDSRTLYVAIFNCTPSWRIDSLVSNAGGGDFLVLQPKRGDNNNKQEVRYRMEVPGFLRKKGLTQCKDIVKVFVTSRATSFASVILPEISLQAGDLHGRVRGAGDQLSEFLSELTAGHRGQDDAMQEEWATRTFLIHTAIDRENL